MSDNLNLSQSNDETVPITISAAIGRFLTALGSGHSPATVRTYQVGIGRFSLYLKEQCGIDPDECPVAHLQPQWAVDCVMWISQGQPPDNSSPSPAPAIAATSVPQTNAKIKAINALEKANTTRRAARTTTATYIAGITRFYRWCSRQRLITLPAEEYDRLIESLSDLRGKIKTNILSKVPADEVIEKLLSAARQPRPVGSASTATDSPGSTRDEVQPDPQKSPSGFRAPAAKMAELDKRRYELRHLRNIALLETLKCTGARVSEVVALSRGDLDATNRRALVVGKGQKERWVYFDTAAWQALQEYFSVRTRLLAQANPLSSIKPSTSQPYRPSQPKRAGSNRSSNPRELAAQPLFARHDRGAGWKTIKPLTTNAIRSVLWELVEQAELETHITPHTFRHWFATRMLSQTGDLAVTQDLLGHADPGTTRIYAQVSETNKQKAFRQVFN